MHQGLEIVFMIHLEILVRFCNFVLLHLLQFRYTVESKTRVMRTKTFVSLKMQVGFFITSFTILSSVT